MMKKNYWESRFLILPEPQKYKKFYNTDTCGLYYKSVTVIIYNCNDSTIVIYDQKDSVLYYKTMIVTNVALAWSINYDRRVVIYDCKDLRVPFHHIKLL